MQEEGIQTSEKWENDPRWKAFSESCGAAREPRQASDGKPKGGARTRENAKHLLEILEYYSSSPPQGLHEKEMELWQNGKYIPSRVIIRDLKKRRIAIDSNELRRLAKRLAEAKLLRNPRTEIVDTARSRSGKEKITLFYGLGATNFIQLTSNARLETIEQKRARVLGILRPYLDSMAIKLGIERERIEAALADSI